MLVSFTHPSDFSPFPCPPHAHLVLALPSFCYSRALIRFLFFLYSAITMRSGCPRIIFRPLPGYFYPTLTPPALRPHRILISFVLGPGPVLIACTSCSDVLLYPCSSRFLPMAVACLFHPHLTLGPPSICSGLLTYNSYPILTPCTICSDAAPIYPPASLYPTLVSIIPHPRFTLTRL